MQDRPQGNRGGQRRSPLLLLILAVGIFALAAGGIYYAFKHRGGADSASTFSIPGTTLKPDPDGVLSTTSESFRMIAKKIGPAVVNIKATRGNKNRAPEEEAEESWGDPFSDLFEQFGMREPFRRRDPSPQTALGSGILIDRQGHVVTNNHVIEGASEIVVSLGENKTEIKAEIAGADAKSDLAVLKLLSLPNALPEPAQWADSDKVEVGDWAVAIGSPFALGQSVTVGIVSAKGRRNAPVLGGSNLSTELLQTDAAINPGNSGGPLCDLEGLVMGVNTAIYTRNGGYMGIGFAIPSNTAKDIVGRLLKDGKIVRGWVGVMIQALEPDLAKELGIKNGVSIHQTVAGGPAAAAGLKAGDIILAVNDQAVSEMTDLQQRISELKPGQTVNLKVMSYLNKKVRQIAVKVAELPANEPTANPTATNDKPDKLGLLVEDAPQAQGVVVRAVSPDSLAEQVGIQAGDVLLRVNRKPVTNVEIYRQILASAKSLSLEIRRKNQNLFLQFPMPE